MCVDDMCVCDMCVPAPWQLKGSGSSNTHGKHGAWRNAALTLQLSPSAGLPLAALGLKKQLVMRIARRSGKKCNNRARFLYICVCECVFSLFALSKSTTNAFNITPLAKAEGTTAEGGRGHINNYR